jgi:hypothetical protein
MDSELCKENSNADISFYCREKIQSLMMSKWDELRITCTEIQRVLGRIYGIN